MKKVITLFCVLVLCGCGAMGIGSNHRTMVYNNSKNVITVTSEGGTQKIKPDSSANIYATEQISIQNKNSACPQVLVERKVNTAALILDIFPGWLLGILPVLVDAVTDNLYRMPEAYSYTCD